MKYVDGLNGIIGLSMYSHVFHNKDDF